MVAFGVVPAAVTYGPHVRLSFHPLRSTLAWALLLHVAGLLSLHRVLATAEENLRVGNVVSSWFVFPAVLAIAHVSCYLLVVTIWAEAHRYKELAALAAKLERLMADMGMPEAGAWPKRSTSRMVWAMVVFMLAFGPLTTALWQFWASGQQGEVYRILAHCMANVMMTSVVGGFCLVQFIIRDAANVLTQRFARDVLRGLSPSEMACYHNAWLALRDLLEGAVVMPASLSFCTLLLVLNNLLCLYNVVNRILSGSPWGRTLILLVLVPHVFLMVLSMCLAADAAVSAIGKFKLPLVKLDPTNARNTYVREVFREVLSYSPGSVSVAGFWYVNRRAATSVLCATITYLIVLIELRAEPHSTVACNRTISFDCVE
ncbi:uncharacterized protein LOC117646211 [Thrips palmi]|uniref:Gustatory receptor n=1 Tax=Thrips palmi TaxID=161013 RepID=A0A6P8ZNT4_THRPL|nr:uncharacterized protein LOC117646211 [Thrips palmi]